MDCLIAYIRSIEAMRVQQQRSRLLCVAAAVTAAAALFSAAFVRLYRRR